MFFASSVLAGEKLCQIGFIVAPGTPHLQVRRGKELAHCSQDPGLGHGGRLGTVPNVEGRPLGGFRADLGNGISVAAGK